MVLNALAGGAEAAANRVFAVAEGTPPSVATDPIIVMTVRSNVVAADGNGVLFKQRCL